MECFVLGLGGTGSRCLESLVHLCAAGLGPDHLWAGLVDPDKANGNVERTKNLMATYGRLRRGLRDPGANNISDDCRFLKTQVDVPKAGVRWSPAPENSGHTLRDILDYPMLGGYQSLIDALFHPMEEQQMKFKVGFRGRPSLGAAVVAARSLEKDPFWSEIKSAAQAVKNGTEVRFFLFGSIFGGTGASTFPTLSLLIRELMASSGVTEGYSIGGALLLPYFYFPEPSDQAGVVAKSAAFREQAQGALRYYRDLLQGRGVFDSLYLLGWDPLIEIPTFCPGGAGQVNPPLMPELYAALAAATFFQSPQVPAAPLYRIGCEANGRATIDWSQIPECDAAGDLTVKAGLGNLVRFAYGYRNVYHEHLTQEPAKRITKQAWYRGLIAGQGVDLGSPGIIDIRGGLDSYSQDLLRWAATIEYESESEDVDIKLFESQAIGQRVTGDVALLHAPSALDLNRFATLVQGRPSSGLDAVLAQLCDARPSSGIVGFGGFAEQLFESCAL